MLKRFVKFAGLIFLAFFAFIAPFGLALIAFLAKFVLFTDFEEQNKQVLANIY
jgi:hypothetical protein